MLTCSGEYGELLLPGAPGYIMAGEESVSASPDQVHISIPYLAWQCAGVSAAVTGILAAVIGGSAAVIGAVAAVIGVLAAEIGVSAAVIDISAAVIAHSTRVTPVRVCRIQRHPIQSRHSTEVDFSHGVLCGGHCRWWTW